MRGYFVALGTVAYLLAGTSLRAQLYEIDPVHSSVEFRVGHMMVSRVRGGFDQFAGNFFYEKGSPQIWKASATIDAASINTGNTKRDDHLRGSDFFNATQCPTLEFRSTQAEGVREDKRKGEARAKLKGDLTMHCVTRPVTLALELREPVWDQKGNLHMGATLTGRVKRKDFGITWNVKLEKGGVMVGEDVDITIDVEGVARP